MRRVLPLSALALSLLCLPAPSALAQGEAAAIGTAVDVMKQINEMNRASQQARAAAEIVSRLQRIEDQLGVIDQKLDIAVAAILRLEAKTEEQRVKTLRGNTLGYIRAVNAFYPGWRTKCLQGGVLRCDDATFRSIELKQNDLVNAMRVFMEMDDYSNITIAVLGMGYEHDLLILLNTPEHNEAVFSRYATYLQNGVAHLEKVRAQRQQQMADLVAAAKPWEVTSDFCASGERVYIFHAPEQRNCRYCLVSLFGGNFRDGWKQTAGWAVRDGQGMANCQPRDPNDRMNEGVYQPAGGSCEYMLEHRNCAHLAELETMRANYAKMQVEEIGSLDALIAQVNDAIVTANAWAAGKDRPNP